MTDMRQPKAEPPDAILTVGEVAALLKVPLSWIYDHCRLPAPEGLPHMKLGKYLRFREREVRDWLVKQQRNRDPVVVK